MAKTALTPQNAPAAWATAPTDFTFAAADAANGNSFPATGREVVIAENTDAGAQTITIASTADSEGRTGDCTLSIPAGHFVVTQMFPTKGWIQTDGNIYITVSSANIKLAVVRFP